MAWMGELEDPFSHGRISAIGILHYMPGSLHGWYIACLMSRYINASHRYLGNNHSTQ